MIISSVNFATWRTSSVELYKLNLLLCSVLLTPGSQRVTLFFPINTKIINCNNSCASTYFYFLMYATHACSFTSCQPVVSLGSWLHL